MSIGCDSVVVAFMWIYSIIMGKYEGTLQHIMEYIGARLHDTWIWKVVCILYLSVQEYILIMFAYASEVCKPDDDKHV